MNTRIGSLPKHLYIEVDSNYTHETPCGFVPGVWFGLVSIPGRMWGLNVMLECGAVYRNLPPHAVSFSKDPEPLWSEEEAQLWDCYGNDWAVHEYTYLRGLRCHALIGNKSYRGSYLFTTAPMNEGFSDSPEQNKEFMFLELDNGRLTIQPTNKVVFEDRSFTAGVVPRLRVQTETWSCE
jgi:hypothetical protein